MPLMMPPKDAVGPRYGLTIILDGEAVFVADVDAPHLIREGWSVVGPSAPSLGPIPYEIDDEEETAK